MPYPVIYDRAYSFTGWQSNNPTKPLPGAQVDAELDNVAESVNGAIGALADVRRADGALKDGIVTPESLDPDFYAAISNGLLPPTADTLRLLDTTILNSLLQRDLQHMKRRIRVLPTGAASGNSLQSHTIDELNGLVYFTQETGSTIVMHRCDWSSVDFTATSGETALVPLDTQPASGVLGHQGMSVDYLPGSTAVRFITRSRANGKAIVRFRYVAGGAPADVETYTLFSGSYSSSTPCLSYAEPGEQSQWLVANALSGTTGVIRVWKWADVLAAGPGADVSADWLYEMFYYEEGSSQSFPFQGICATDTHIWTTQTGFNLDCPKMMRCYKITGGAPIWQSAVNLGRNQASAEDENNENWEGESIALFRARAGAPLSMAISIVTGPNGARHNGFWIVGVGEPDIRRVDGLSMQAFFERVRFGSTYTSAVAGVTPQIQVHGQGQGRSSVAILNWSASSQSEPNIIIGSSVSGKIGAYTPLADGDNLMKMLFVGDNGDGLVEVMQLFAEVDGPLSGANIPGRLTFFIKDGSGGSKSWLWRASGTYHPGGDDTQNFGGAGARIANAFVTRLRPGAGTAIWTSGAGTPEGAVTAPIGSLYTRTDGGAGTTLYIKESGTGNTGWAADTGNYETASWTPTLGFATDGDLSVVYASQSGAMTRNGQDVTLDFRVVCTPTFTTASGQARLSGIPYAPINSYMAGAIADTTGLASWPASATMLNLRTVAAESYLRVTGHGSGIPPADVQAAQFTSGVEVTIAGSISYRIAA